MQIKRNRTYSVALLLLFLVCLVAQKTFSQVPVPGIKRASEHIEKRNNSFGCFAVSPKQATLNTCETWTYQIKIGSAGITEKANDLTVFSSGDFVLGGEYINILTGAIAGLLIKLDPNGTIIWNKTISLPGHNIAIKKVRLFSDSRLYLIAEQTNIATNIIKPVLICLDANGVLIWGKEIQVQGIAGSWKAIDLDEWREASFSFLIHNDSLLTVGRISMTGNTIWNKTFKADHTPSPIGIKNDYWDSFVSYNEVDSGYTKAVMLDLDYTDGHQRFCTKLGGASDDSSSYLLNSMKLINLRPRITATRIKQDGTKVLTRINYTPIGTPSLRESFIISSLTPDSTTYTDHDNWSEVFSTTPVLNSQEIILTYSFPDNYNTPIKSKKIVYPEALQRSIINKSVDGGNLIISSTMNNDIIITKVDSIGSLPACPVQPLSSTFTSEAANYQLDTLPDYNYPLLLTNIFPIINPNSSDTIANCRAIFCPVVPEPDTCLRTFFKEYRNSSNTILFREIEKTSNSRLLVTGFSRDIPYLALDASILALFDTSGKIIDAKRLAYSSEIFLEKTIRLNDNNFIAAGYIYHNYDSLEQFILKFDNSLNIIWIKKLVFTPRFRSFINIIESNEGDIYCYMRDELNSSVEKRYLLKLNSDGAAVWFREYDAGQNIFWGSAELTGLITQSEDFVYLKYNEESSDFSPHIIKIRKTDGSVVWVKKYRFNNNNHFYSRSLHVVGNSIYLFGGISDIDNNYILTKLDDAGNVLQSVKLDFLQSGPYTAKIKNGDHFIINSTIISPPTLINGIIEIDTSFQIINKSFIQLPKPGYIDNLTFFSDSVTYGVGSFFYDNAYWASAYLQKYNFNGLSGVCEVPNFPISSENVSVVITSKVPGTNTLSLPVITDFNLLLSPASFSYNNLHCNGNQVCTQINLTGPVSICDSSLTYTYNLTRNPGCNGKIFWEIDSLPGQIYVIQQTDTSIVIRSRSNGVIKIKPKLFGGCNWVEDSLQINITILSQMVNLGPDTLLCPNNTKILNARSGYLSYLWQDGSTDSTFNVTIPGLYWVEVKDGCNTISRDSVIVSPAPPIAFDLGADLIKCNNDSLTITAPPGFLNYTWSPNYNITTATGQVSTVFPAVDTMYKVTAEKTPGCFAYDSVLITVNNSPPINLGPNTSFCNGDSLILDAGTGFTGYQWNNGQTSPSISVKAAGSYFINAVAANGCISRDTLIIANVFNNPVINLGSDAMICEQSVKQLNAGAGYSSYTWSTGNTSPAIAVNSTGSYWVTVTDNNNCKGADTILINGILPVPKKFLPADTVLCSYSSITLNPLATFTAYLWNTGASSPAIKISLPGTYSLQVLDANNCTGKDTIIITPKQCLDGFYIPDAFTPNNDGKNDIFRPLLFGNVAKYEFSIYNRWGQVVFTTKDLQKGWNGKVTGVDTDTNVFVWQCSFQFEGQPAQFRKGTLTLIR